MEIRNVRLTFFPYDVEYVKDNFTSALGTEYNVNKVDENEEPLDEYYIQQYGASKVPHKGGYTMRSNMERLEKMCKIRRSICIKIAK